MLLSVTALPRLRVRANPGAAQLHTATEHRKTRNPLVLGFQGRSQLEESCGRKAEAVLSQPATKIFLTYRWGQLVQAGADAVQRQHNGIGNQRGKLYVECRLAWKGCLGIGAAHAGLGNRCFFQGRRLQSPASSS